MRGGKGCERVRVARGLGVGVGTHRSDACCLPSPACPRGPPGVRVRVRVRVSVRASVRVSVRISVRGSVRGRVRGRVTVRVTVRVKNLGLDLPGAAAVRSGVDAVRAEDRVQQVVAEAGRLG